MNNPFDYTPDAACDEAFRNLTDRIETIRKSDSPVDINFIRELEAGKMLGILIAEDRSGDRHTLYAFSGQIGEGGFDYEGFVEPVFDYLQPDGHFRRRESDISRQNRDIDRVEEEVAALSAEYEDARRIREAEVAEYRERCRVSKMTRDARRGSGEADKEELERLIRQSQFEKAELHRIKKRVKGELAPLAARLEDARTHLERLREKRRSDSEALQKWLFDEFRVLDAYGRSRSLSEIFAETPMGVPPSGAGECCAPKLLQGAYRRGWRPVSIAEYWYGRPKGGELRIHGSYYPACRGKCRPVLGWMLQGVDVNPPLDREGDDIDEYGHSLRIIYENRWFCVVDKPSGMLSVPGKGRALSVQDRLAERYGAARQVRMAHRLDRDTSGLMIATFGPEAYREMQALFATRHINKEYIAQLEGDWRERGVSSCGRIELPLMPDWTDRPRQRVDRENGKPAVTDYRFLGVRDGRSDIVFHPLTGRTHQLRVHAASDSGLGMPIVGDPLYGLQSGAGECRIRLHLHARRLEFTFPINGEHYIFESPDPFGNPECG